MHCRQRHFPTALLLWAVLAGAPAAQADPSPPSGLQDFRSKREFFESHFAAPLPYFKLPEPVLNLFAHTPLEGTPYAVSDLSSVFNVVLPIRNEAGAGGRRVLLDVEKLQGHYERRGEATVFVAVCAETSPNSLSDASVGTGVSLQFSWQVTPFIELHGSFAGCVGLGIGGDNPKQAQEIVSAETALGTIVRLSPSLYFRFDYRLEYRSTLRHNGAYSKDFHADGGGEAISTQLFVVGGSF